MADAARLVGTGEIVVFGSSALAFWMRNAPPSRDIDIWCEPTEQGHAVTALMGELSWYHDRHGLFVEVWAPETFAAPRHWRSRARTLAMQDQRVTVLVPHPHDILMAKLERMEVKEGEHAAAILAEFPLDEATLDALADEMPHRHGLVTADRAVSFEAGLRELRVMRRRGA